MSAATSPTLVDAIQHLSFARSLEEVTTVVRMYARQLTAADGVTFVLRDDGQCYYADEDAVAPLWKGARFPIHTCVSGLAMLDGEPIVIPDIYIDARVPHEAYRPTFVRSLAMVPIRPDDALGAIGAYWATHHVATDSELAVLTSLANAAALAFENVRLYSELQVALAKERDARLHAEQANRAKDDFLATLSHELRTPITVVQGWLWQLRHTPLAADRAQRGLEVIERNVGIQARMVEDLLDVSRAIGGTLNIRRRLVDVGLILQRTVELLTPSAALRGLTLRLQVDAVLPAMAWADADRLQQVFTNIIGNAVKFTPDGGTIDVCLGRPADRLQITFRDTGIGIDAAFLPHVFDRFRQADQSSTRAHGGLGLGLAIVKQLMELHRGEVRVESEGLGRGATVIVELPVAAVLTEPVADATAGMSGTSLAGISVIVVDDEPDACAIIAHVLRQHGARALTAFSAPEALALCEREDAHVLLSDLSMPGMDGIALLRAVRQLAAPASGIPAVALSALVGDDHRAGALRAGYSLYLEKPVAPGELAERLRQLAQ